MTAWWTSWTPSPIGYGRWTIRSAARRWSTSRGHTYGRSPGCCPRASTPTPVGRRLHAGLAEILRPCGWLSFDASQQPQAQRYFHAALPAARTAGDAAAGANIEAGASDNTGVETRSTAAFDIYLHGQLPATLGLVVASVGVGHAIAEAGARLLTTATRLPMCLGVALYLLALASTQAALRGGLSVNALWPAAGAAALPMLVLLGQVVPPTGSVGLVAAVVLATLGGGLRRKASGALPVVDAPR